MSGLWGYLIYVVFALGGASIYLMMPRAGASKMRGGAVLGLAALTALIVALWQTLTTDDPKLTFFLFALIALIAAARVITHTIPVYSAIYFVLVVVAVAALLVLQGAEFTAVALIIVYAGAILVTYLFVIMLAQQSDAPACDRRAREPFLAVLAGFVLMATVAGRAAELPQVRASTAITVSDTSPPADLGNTTAIGQIIMTRYVVAFELAGLLLLVSMVGAIAMARKRLPVGEVAGTPPPPPLGKIGREVPPW